MEESGGHIGRGQTRGHGTHMDIGKQRDVARLLSAPERIRTSTTYSGHKALNLATWVCFVSDASISGTPVHERGRYGRIWRGGCCQIVVTDHRAGGPLSPLLGALCDSESRVFERLLLLARSGSGRVTRVDLRQSCGLSTRSIEETGAPLKDAAPGFEGDFSRSVGLQQGVFGIGQMRRQWFEPAT